MKHWKCPNCHNERVTEGNIVMVRCGCGEYMVFEEFFEEVRVFK